MRTFLIMPENCRWQTITANNHDIAFRSEAHWYKGKTRIAIMDVITGETQIFIAGGNDD